MIIYTKYLTFIIEDYNINIYFSIISYIGR